jgi:ATP-dependent DNA helicase RecG
VPPPPARRRPAKPAPGPITAPVTLLKGVSTVNQKRLALLGIHTVRDLLYHLPRRYDDFAQLKTINRLQLDDEVTIVGIVKQVSTQRLRSGRPLTLASITDGTGTIEARWFNQPYLGQRLAVGAEIALSGRVSAYLGRLVFVSPEWEPLEHDLLHTAGLIPVYPLTGGVPLRWLRRLIKGALDDWTPSMEDPLPADFRRSAGLIDLPTALQQVHFPSSQAILARARERLCFDELFLLQLGIMRHRQAWRAQRGRAFELPHADVAAFIAGLPFPLTGAQQRAIDTILADLAQPVPMNRLLQGDVGSGKTVVAAAAVLAAARNGLQAAMMAPTSILAEQHYRTLSRLLGAGGLRCELLTGGVPAGERERIQEDLRRGLVQVVVGTHALLQEAVDFGRLGLIVVDEQHRFGVAQRMALQAKGNGVQPHMLAMSATPIPRSLALTIYGDLDVSVLDEMPAHRQPVFTAVRGQESRERIYSFIRSQVEAGTRPLSSAPGGGIGS